MQSEFPYGENIETMLQRFDFGMSIGFGAGILLLLTTQLGSIDDTFPKLYRYVIL